MKRFYYKAKNKDNQLVTGEVEAQDEQNAARLVRGKGLTVISIRPIAGSIFDFFKKYRERITSKDISTFTRQLSTMINAGLPLTEGLLILRSQSKGTMQKMVSQLLSEVEGGEAFSSALQKQGKIFSTTYIALIKSGELGGVLDDVLAKLADNMEKQQEFAGKVKGALIYPVIVIVGMVAVAIVMMLFVIPKLTSLYSEFGATLPLPTRILMGISGFMLKAWPLMLILLGFGIYLYSSYRKSPIGRKKTDELLFKLPIIGDLQRQVILTDITRTLSMMVGAGVSILDGLNITSEVVSNMVIKDALKDAAKQVEKGFPVAFSFAKHPEAFPYILSQMVAVGEETGKMEDVLKKISHVFEVESDEQVKNLTAAIEPLVMIVLGVGVGFLVIAVILPIYNLTSQFS
jgi:type IV pilus assembly protein PilC